MGLWRVKKPPPGDGLFGLEGVAVGAAVPGWGSKSSQDERFSTARPEDLDVLDADCATPDLTTFYRLIQLGLQAVGQRLESDRPIHAYLTVVFTALAVTHCIQDRTGWSIKKFVRTARRYRTVRISTGRRELTAADPLPRDLRDALAAIHHTRDLRRNT